MAQAEGSVSTPPPAPNSGQFVVTYLRELRRWINQNKTVAGAGLTAVQTQSGRVLSVVKKDVLGLTHPWKLVKSSTALDLEMVDGILFTSTNGTGACTPQTVSTAALTLTNGTHKIWFKAEVSNAEFATYFVQWQVDTVTVESGAAVPADTLDLTDIAEGAGDVYVEIGEVVAAGGAITTITQTLSTPYTLVFPLAIDLKEFECPVEEEPE